MSTAGILFFALILDALFGEPKWIWDRIPHPAVLIGKLIGRADKSFNTGSARKLKGIALVGALLVIAWIIGVCLSFFGWAPSVLFAAILLAQKSLVEHVRDVAAALRVSLGDGQRAVGKIVSRDTRKMNASEVSRSAIESAAENLSDGVIAPAFWFLIAGLPGLLAYKAINTADSMIGYNTPKYEAFGWAAARLDDLLNWVPARLTAVLIALTHGGMRAMGAIQSEAVRHRSPNAGWPEAAMARVLNVALSGPRVYYGTLQDYPFVNDFGRKDIGANEIDAACSALWRSWSVLLIITGCLALL